MTSISTGRPPRDEAVDAGTETSAGEHGREDPAGQLAKLGVAPLGVTERGGEQRLRAARPRAALATGCRSGR